MPRKKAASVNGKTEKKETNGMSGLLNLAGADTSGGDFPAMPAGTYEAEVYDIGLKETKGGPEAKLPGGTKMLNFQFRITEDREVEFKGGSVGSVENRRVFRSYTIAPEGYEKKAMMDGMIVNLLVALGEDKDEVMSETYDFDPENLKNRPCRVTLGVKLKYNVPTDEEYEIVDAEDYENEVKGVKAPVEQGAIL